MASKAHQFIIDLLVQRLNNDGYEVVSFDGASQIENIVTKIPPKIKRHRPDLIGIKNDCLAIGEAKTANDIGLRTREQLEDYALSSHEIEDVKIISYIGIPESVKEKVNGIVDNITYGSSLKVLTVPDRLLPLNND